MTMARLRWRFSVQHMARAARFLLLAIFLAALFLLYSSASSERSSAALEKDIARLSVYYVRALARERGLKPPPHAVDLQHSLSVLLQSVLSRMGNLENFLAANASRAISVATRRWEAVNRGTPASLEAEQRRFDAFINFQRLRARMEAAGTKCELPSDWRESFPECENKLGWMSRNFKTDACYSAFGVDESRCSHLLYLSEIESFCPRLPDLSPLRPDPEPTLHQLRTLLLRAPTDVAERAVGVWSLWRRATKMSSMGKVGKRVALYRASHRAPDDLETRVWADLTSGLHALGHTVVWLHDSARLDRLLAALPNKLPSTPCPARPDALVDLIVADEPGREAISARTAANYPNLACTMRVVEVDGAAPVRDSPPPGMLWSQFFTAYPDQHDHSFLGFAEPRRNYSHAGSRRIALILASHPSEFSGAGPYLKAIDAHFSLHTLLPEWAVARVARLLSPHVPQFTNHRPGQSLGALLDRSALLVGLGSPLNPPIAIEALSRGVLFLNPVFDPPRLVSNHSETWTVVRQHTYLARHVGEPWSVSVDLLRPDDVERRLRRVRTGISFVPMDFSHEGYVRRLASILDHHDLCSPFNPLEPQWPPAKSVEFYLAVRGDSCEATCRKRDRLCEPAYFPIINSRIELEERNIRCTKVFYRSDPLFPAVDIASHACHFQSEPRRFSCFHRPSTSALQRICPCRDHKPGQLALCKDC